MKALVKAKAEPGLWLQDVPEPAVGINDVLSNVLKTGIDLRSVWQCHAHRAFVRLLGEDVFITGAGPTA